MERCPVVPEDTSLRLVLCQNFKSYFECKYIQHNYLNNYIVLLPTPNVSCLEELPHIYMQL